jgi:hypothetical protein
MIFGGAGKFSESWLTLPSGGSGDRCCCWSEREKREYPSISLSLSLYLSMLFRRLAGSWKKGLVKIVNTKYFEPIEHSIKVSGAA